MYILIVKKDFEFTEIMIDELFITALEGGSNYWYMLHNDETPLELNKDNTVNWFKSLQNNGVSISDLTVSRKSGTKPYKKILKIPQIQTGLTRMAHDDRREFDNILKSEYDACDADVFLQYCVFGEIVYG